MNVDVEYANASPAGIHRRLGSGWFSQAEHSLANGTPLPCSYQSARPRPRSRCRHRASAALQ